MFVISDILWCNIKKLQIKLKKKDVETMKVLHDFKNPINSLKSELERANYDESTKSAFKYELLDMQNMLENLSTGFKLK